MTSIHDLRITTVDWWHVHVVRLLWEVGIMVSSNSEVLVRVRVEGAQTNDVEQEQGKSLLSEGVFSPVWVR